MNQGLNPSSPFIGLAMFIGLWQALAWAINRPIMPSPIDVLPIFFVSMLGDLGLHFLASAGRVLTSIGLAFVTAVPIGLGLGGCPRIEFFFEIDAYEKKYHRHMVDIPRIIF